MVNNDNEQGLLLLEVDSIMLQFNYNSSVVDLVSREESGPRETMANLRVLKGGLFHYALY